MTNLKKQKRTRLLIVLLLALACFFGVSVWIYSTLNSKERFVKLVQQVLDDNKIPIHLDSIDGELSLKDLLQGKVKNLTFKATLVPLQNPFQGTVQIDIGATSVFDFTLQSLAAVQATVDAVTLKAARWSLKGSVVWEKSATEPKLPFSIDAEVTLNDFVFSKDALWIEEPVIALHAAGNTDTKIFRGVKLDLLKPLRLLVEAEGGENKISGKFNFNNPLQALVDERLVPWLSSEYSFLRRAKAKGDLRITGDFDFLPKEQELKKKIKLRSHVSLKAKQLEMPAEAFSFTNLNLSLPLSFPDRPGFGRLDLQSLEYQSIKLKPLQLRLKATHEWIDITTEKEDGSDKPLVQPLWGSEVKVSELYASYEFGGTPEFTLAVEGGPFLLAKMQSDFCVLEDKPLEGWVKFSYPELLQDEKALHLIGKAEMQVFSGTVKTGDLHFLFDDPQPKIHFSSEWSDLDLHAMGEWVGFGDMRGSLDGMFKDVVIVLSPVGPVATSYDFLVRGVPRANTPVRLYGRAVKNIMRLLGTDPQEMPLFPKLGLNISTGFLNIFPLKIDYLGFHAKTNGGWTELRTFDPEEDQRINDADKKHYLLKGAAFTIPFRAVTFDIPLNSHGVYPAILKTEAFQFWLKQMLDIFKNLAKDEEGKSDEKKECVPIF